MWRNKLCHTSPNTWDLYSGNQLVKIPLKVSCLPCPGWIGRCVFGKMLFFGSWAYPKCTLRIPKPNWKNAWFWRAVVWYPAVQLEKTFVLCDYLGCAVEKKGVPCGCHFAPVILRQSFSLLAGKRPLTDWGMKTYFSRPESLPELRRLREHIKWHIWCGRIANPMESRWKCLTTDSKSPRWDFENP